MEEVTYKDFAKMDLRVVTIENVESIQGADKLFKLTINTGMKKRTIVAGIKPYYNASDLQGKQVIIIANLEPRKIRGITSHGMMLAGQDERTVAVLRPDKKLNNGAKVL